ncbi:hypothetical protein Lal_00012136 [Lupinus albus]|nr:hypothetical protein Lal_00012136 [Lupinus albus]
MLRFLREIGDDDSNEILGGKSRNPWGVAVRSERGEKKVKIRCQQPKIAISRPGETTLSQERILQYSPGFHPPRSFNFNSSSSVFCEPISISPAVGSATPETTTVQYSLDLMNHGLTTPTTSILVNGNPAEQIHLKRDLRQGDPLSPFFFLIVVEGLSGPMRQASSLGFFNPYMVGSGGIPISLLQFVNDAILIGDFSYQNIWVMKSILQLFELSSGLKINFTKSNLYGVNIEEDHLTRLVEFLHCELYSKYFSYLGIPVSVSHKHEKSKKFLIIFAYIVLTRHDHKPPLHSHHSHLLWKSRVPLKVTTFAWRLFQDRIPTKDALLRRGFSSSDGGGILCSFCNEHPEFTHHLFPSCSLTYSV